ncbi:MAG: plastocyanin/azurin family copper-binding protein, partial [Chloroflexota bacterium]|nr:plastocyanin/azurin family copper-binding protein [Chloroflexota bacterium]
MAVVSLLVVSGSLAFAQAQAVRIVEGSSSDINSWGYEPASLTVRAGQPVTFTNTGAQAHTATATGVFDTGLLGTGESATITVATPGTYEYHCTPHPWMRASLVVM